MTYLIGASRVKYVQREANTGNREVTLVHLLDGPFVFGGECVVQKLCDYRGLAHFGGAHDDDLVTCIRRPDSIVHGIVAAHSVSERRERVRVRREDGVKGIGLWVVKLKSN